MRFTSVFVAGTFAILAAAQSSEVTTVPGSAASPTVQLSPAQSSQYACVAACDEGDVNCQAKCVPVPSPNEKQVNATNECVAACDLGSGTEADNKKYEACRDGCIEKHYYKTEVGTPQQTAGSGSGSGGSGSGSNGDATRSGSAADSTGTSGSDSDDADSTATDSESSGTATGSGAAATTTAPNAAGALAVGSASILAVVAAVLAL